MDKDRGKMREREKIRDNRYYIIFFPSAIQYKIRKI
jgi:hypothetical protein